MTPAGSDAKALFNASMVLIIMWLLYLAGASPSSLPKATPVSCNLDYANLTRRRLTGIPAWLRRGSVLTMPSIPLSMMPGSPPDKNLTHLLTSSPDKLG
jgi:hypothetical protein